jgi:hypothetical protein
MEVHVRDELGGRFAVREKEVDALTAEPGMTKSRLNSHCLIEQNRAGVRREICEDDCVRTGDEEDVARIHGPIGHERDQLVVSVDFARWPRSISDGTKRAIVDLRHTHPRYA